MPAVPVAACGGSGTPLTAERYFAWLEANFAQAEAEMTAAGEAFQAVLDAADLTAEARDAAYVARHRRNRGALAAQREALAGPDPPAEMAGAHQEPAAAVGEMVEALERALGSRGEAPPPKR